MINSEIRILKGKIKHCKKALSSKLEKWERKEYLQVKTEAENRLKEIMSENQQSYLDGVVDCYSAAEIKQLGITQDKSLGKTKQKSPYEVINEKLIAMLKKGDLPWINQRTSAPYKGQDATFRNFITKRAYSGVNTLMLSAEVQDHHNSFFLTQSQVESKGKAIKKGAKPFVIFFTKKLSVTKETPATDTAPATSQEKKIWFLRQYVVYNVADTTIELKEKDQPKAKTLTQVIESCETIYPNMPKRPPLQHKGSGAFYQPASDFVNMPVQSTFTTLQGYYRTFFHELIHSTGHEKRLKRKFAMSKNSTGYAVEELIAEIGSSYICGYTGIFFANAEKHASYLNHYLKELHGSKLAQYKADLVLKAQEDKTYLLHAIGAAQKGANFILSKQLAKAKKDKELKSKSKTLAGTIRKTDIKKLKAAVKNYRNLGRAFKKTRSFEPYTLTDHVAEYLLNRRVKKDSFRRYGDARHLTGKSGNLYRLHWLGSKGNHKEQPMDQMASDFISEYPQFHSVDESQVINEMAEIIINYPTGAGAYMDDRIRQQEFEKDRYNEDPVEIFPDPDHDSFPQAPKAEREIEMLQHEVLALKLKLVMSSPCSLNGKQTGLFDEKKRTKTIKAHEKALIELYNRTGNINLKSKSTAPYKKGDLFYKDNQSKMFGSVIKSTAEIGEQILWSSGRESLCIATITKETEKAVKIDYTLESVWSNSALVVFTRTAWVPKSAIINDNDNGGLTVKPWFKNAFKGGPKIKSYYIVKGKKVFMY